MNILKRDEIPVKDRWDLHIMCTSRDEWEHKKKYVEEELARIMSYEGKIKEDETLILTLFKTLEDYNKSLHHVCAYAFLMYASDSTTTENQEMISLATHLQAHTHQALTFVAQELSALSDPFLQSISHNTLFKDYAQSIINIMRNKPHVLSKPEEQLLANQSEYKDGFYKIFSALNDTDLVFGTVETPEGPVAITHSTMSVLREHKERSVRKESFEKYHAVYESHLNTLTHLYASQILQDNATAKIRKYKSSLDHALYGDNIPETLYHDLISITHKYLPVLHKYYSLLKQQLQIEDFAYYDLSVNPYPVPEHDMKYEEAVKLVCASCKVLGDEYTSILEKGLLEHRWVDVYESKGKRSGAFSMGVYGAYPYILLNYQSKTLQHVFTLAHEAGHSMHSYFAFQENSYTQSDYSIFEAEVASTVNEFLLYRYLRDTTEDENKKIYLLWHEIQDFIATFFRQVMFAEIEYRVHHDATQGKPLTSHYFQDLFYTLFSQYCGKDVIIPSILSTRGLSIPHFYRSFYVFQYATGIAAATDIGARLYRKEQNTVNDYLSFLKSGGSRFPIDSLKLAGVDYTTSLPLENALEEFTRMTEQLAEFTNKS